MGILALVSIAGLVVSCRHTEKGYALKLILGAMAQEGYGVILCAVLPRKLDYARETAQ